MQFFDRFIRKDQPDMSGLLKFIQIISGNFSNLEKHQINLGVLIMDVLANLKSDLAKLATDVAAVKQAKDDALAKIATLSDQIAALTAQLASGTLVSQADVDALDSQVNAVDATVAAIPVPAIPAAPTTVTLPSAVADAVAVVQTAVADAVTNPVVATPPAAVTDAVANLAAAVAAVPVADPNAPAV